MHLWEIMLYENLVGQVHSSSGGVTVSEEGSGVKRGFKHGCNLMFPFKKSESKYDKRLTFLKSR